MEHDFRNTHTPRRPFRAGGFSLIEVLVAFVIFALAIGALLAALSGASRLAGLTDDYNRATLLAESLLASLEADPAIEGERHGAFGERFRWQLRAEPYAAFNAQQAGISVRPLWVTAEVQWGEEDNLRSVALATLHLAPQP